MYICIYMYVCIKILSNRKSKNQNLARICDGKAWPLVFLNSIIRKNRSICKNSVKQSRN